MILTIEPELIKNAPFSGEAMKVFNKSLWITVQGMTGIFIAIVVFYLAIRLLGKIRDSKE